MPVTLAEATIKFRDGKESDLEDVVILDNGWVKANIQYRDDTDTETYFSPLEVAEVTEL